MVTIPRLDIARDYGRWLSLVTLLALGLRLFRLGHQSLWIDEGMSFAWIDEIDARGPRALLQNIHGPLHAFAIYATSRISTSEWWLRLPSVVAGTLAVPALSAVVRRLWGVHVALLAALLMALSPFGLFYAQEVRNYAFTLLFASLATLAVLDFARRPDFQRGWRLVVAELLAILSNLNGLFLVAGLQAWLVAALRRERRALACWALCQLVLVAVLVPYAVEVQRQVRVERMMGVQAAVGESAPLRGETTLHPMSLPYAAFAFAAGYSLGPTLEELRQHPAAAADRRHWPALLLVSVGFGVPLVLAVARHWQRACPLLVPSLVVCAITLWLAAANIKPFNARYLSVLQPGFLGLVALGLLSLQRQWRALAITAALAASLWSSANYLFVPRYGRDDTRGVVAYLRAHAGPRDLVLHINLGFSLAYYAELNQEIRLADPGSGDSPAAARRYLDRIRGDAPVLWYLECRPEKLDPEGHLRRACAEGAVSTSMWQFTGIRVYRFDYTAAADPPSGPGSGAALN